MNSNSSDTPESDPETGPATPTRSASDAYEYIRSMSADLGRMASESGDEFLAYLLAMVEREANKKAVGAKDSAPDLGGVSLQ